MNRFLILIVLIFCSSLYSKGQSIYGDAAKADVKMSYVYTLEDALKMAKIESKPIFFNCFADWALPCHGMNKLVFSDKKFCDFMNENFVNLFMDLSKLENKTIAEKYNVKTFAHYLVLDNNGNIIHRIVGGKPLPYFKDIVAMALDYKTSLAGLKERYINGERNKELLRRYCIALMIASDEEMFETIKNEYIKIIDKLELSKNENWAIFIKILGDADSEMFDYLLENKEIFIKNNGDEVYNIIASKFVRYLFPYTTSNGSYDEKKILEIYKKMKSSGLPDDNIAFLYYKMVKARNEKQNDIFLETLQNNYEKFGGQIAEMLDLSLRDLEGLTKEQEERITNYLIKRSETKTKSTKAEYLKAINQMKGNGIIFEKGTFADLLKKAQKQNKPIFLDCYTSWCGPCKMMANRIFTLKEVGDYFNQEFLNYKLDMEKGEGRDLAKKFNVKVYPTMLILNPSGEIIHKFCGGCPPGELLRKVKLGLDYENSYSKIKSEYKAGNRTPELMIKYFKVMSDACETRNINQSAEEYFFELSEIDRVSAEMWPIIEKYAVNLNNKIAEYFINNGHKYAKIIDQGVYDKKIEYLLFPEVLRMIKEQTSKDEFKKIKALIKKCNKNKHKTLDMLVDIAQLYFNKNTNKLFKYYVDNIEYLPNMRDKLNLDLLWLHMINNTKGKDLTNIIDYIERQVDKANESSAYKYNYLLEKVKEKI